MKVLDLFSGIGGFSLGLERAGMETVAFCEYDEKCRKVLKKHWPEIPQYNDVRELTAEKLIDDGISDIGLICGGYPCQPFSHAGKRAGAEDDRHLWPEIKRLLTEFINAGRSIDWCLFENVAGHISMGLDSVLADLESLGYTSQTFVIPACAVGAYHRRDRVWIIAHANELTNGQQYIDEAKQYDAERSVHDVANSYSINRSADGKESNARSDGRDEFGGSGKDVADTLHQRLQRGPQAGDVEIVRQRGNEFTTGRGERSEPGNWLPESGMGRVATGVSGRVDRLKQLGNSVVPQVVEVIGNAIMEAA